MTLEEAIRHAEEKAKRGGKCGEDHAQLATWLKELKMLQSAQPKNEERKEESAQNVLKDDSVSRKAAIDAVNGVIADYIPTLYGRYEALPLEMATAIKRLPTAQPEQRWIPCSERLPDKNGSYLVTDGQGAVNKRRFEDGRWCGGWAVIAWMPLPKPYGGEQDGSD